MEAEELIRRYYDAFNRGEVEAMLGCLAEDVRHEVNQGDVRLGKPAFREFLAHMERCYDERLEDLVVMTDRADRRAAAEFTVQGVYKATDPGLPEAAGQRYTLPAGAFFEIRDGRITRVATCYNLKDWMRQVGG